MPSIYTDESIWLTLKMVGVLYDLNVDAVNGHLKIIYADSVLDETPVVGKFRRTAADREADADRHDHFDAVLSLGYRIHPGVRPVSPTARPPKPMLR